MGASIGHNLIDLNNNATALGYYLKDINISNNSLSFNVNFSQCGIWNHGEPYTFERISVVGNTYTGGRSFQVSMLQNSIIKDNNLYNTTYGIEITIPTNNTIIENNTVQGSSSGYDTYIDTPTTFAGLFLINNSIKKYRINKGIGSITDEKNTPVVIRSVYGGTIIFKYTMNSVFTENGAGAIIYYPDRSEYVTVGDEDVSITKYPMTAIPSTGIATVSVASFNTALPMGSVLANFTANTTNGNNVTFTVSTLKPNINYLIKKGTVDYTTVQADSTGKITFANSIWPSNNFTVTETISGIPTSTPTPGHTSPSAPQILTSTSGDSTVTLSWLTPASNGGSLITSYKVYRGTSSSTETLLTTGGCSSLGNVLTCTDSNLTNNTTYYYQATALNSIGESAKSNETIANPQATRIQGTVSNSSSTPIAGATVSAGTSTTTTNASGFYTLSVPAGSYTLTASSSAYSSQSKPASVSIAQTTTINFTLTQTDAAPPVRSNPSPSGTLAANTTQTTLTLTTSETATCKYATSPNTLYSAMTSTFTSTSSTAHSQTLTNLTNGTSYNYFIRCQDTASNPNIDDLVISFSVANVPPPPPLPPARSQGSPSGILSTGTAQANLALTTNIAAACKYATSPSTAYALMPNTFSTTNSTSHSQILTNLANGQSYSYYIKCQANSISNSDDYVISFSVANPPATTPGGGGPSNSSGQAASDTTPPAKVSNLIASSTASQVLLTWINPTDGDYVKTKILRKENSYSTSVTDGTIVFDDNKNSFIDSNLKSGTTYYYSVYAYDTSSNYSLASQATIVTKGTPLPSEALAKDGTLLKTSSSPKVYVIIQSKKKWISTPEVFETLGYKWTAITITTDDVLKSITDYEDNLIRANGDYKVWLVTNGIRHHVPNPEIFLDYGFAWTEVKDVPQATIDQYQLARLIRESKQGKIYYLSATGIKKWIPTAEIFSSYNNRWEDIQVISKKEMDSYPVSNLMSYNNQVFLIQGTTKRLIPNETILKRYDKSLMLGANQKEWSWFKLGASVR